MEIVGIRSSPSSNRLVQWFVFAGPGLTIVYPDSAFRFRAWILGGIKINPSEAANSHASLSHVPAWRA